MHHFYSYAFKALLVLTIIILSGCTSAPKVHLFATHLEGTEVNRISTYLKKNDIDLSVNYLPFPENIHDNSLLYLPTYLGDSQIERLLKFSEKLGYKIKSTNIISQGNHSFTANNIGLYLLPDNYVEKEQHYPISLVNEYGSRTCENATILQLNNNETFSVEVDTWDDITKQYNELLIEGTWQHQAEKTVVLSSKSWQQSLKLSREFSIKETENGRWQVASLTPVERDDYKEDIQPFVCIYTISMVM
jgi:hypothetical protein